ncbi:MAG TPA: BON domain-containing protein [Blastocatellia bacterium]|nr:BON domain-containing protein [Blastocatellia bacterium]
MNRLAVFFISVVLAAVFAVGCDTNTNTNANSNSRAAARDNNVNKNGRSVSREDFDKQKDRFAKEAKDLGNKIGTGAEDLWIWTKTRAALASADGLTDSTIKVDVDNNAVTLTGTVPDAAQKSKAEQVARGIEGVTGVKNEIQVAPAGSDTNRNAGTNRNTNRNRNAR